MNLSVIKLFLIIICWFEKMPETKFIVSSLYLNCDNRGPFNQLVKDRYPVIPLRWNKSYPSNTIVFVLCKLPTDIWPYSVLFILTLFIFAYSAEPSTVLSVSEKRPHFVSELISKKDGDETNLLVTALADITTFRNFCIHSLSTRLARKNTTWILLSHRWHFSENCFDYFCFTRFPVLLWTSIYFDLWNSLN